MVKVIKETIHANGIDIGIYTQDFENEFISLIDIARYKSDDPNFKPLEFEGFKKQAGANAFTMSPKKWIEATDASGYVECGFIWKDSKTVESYNAILINQGKNQKERMELLRQLAVQQLQTLEIVSLNNLTKLDISSERY